MRICLVTGTNLSEIAPRGEFSAGREIGDDRVLTPSRESRIAVASVFQVSGFAAPWVRKQALRSSLP
jgi:hypothetical protein